MSDSPFVYAVLIPAYRPSGALVEVVQALASLSGPPIVVVDDGSGPEYAAVFARVSAFPGVQLVRHAVNLGKGAALKTGINFALCHIEGLGGVVTADADGQHHSEDILRVGSALADEPGALVLGCRAFAGEVPLRSRFGNLLTSGVMHALLGRKISDTQTGLRGIPVALLERILRLEATGYEFELETLLAAHHLGLPIREIEIRTIYEDGNKSSHFNPILDSIKIYFVLLRFGSVSLVTALLDNLVFYLVYRRTGHILGAQIAARIVGLTFNYTAVRASVFYSRQSHASVLPKYLALAACSGSVSYGGILALTHTGLLSTVPAKLLVETILFFVNFAVQRLLIFRSPESGRGSGAQEARVPQPARKWTAGERTMAALAAAATVYTAIRLADGSLLSQHLWDKEGFWRAARYTGLYLGVALPLLALVPWLLPMAVLVALLALSTAAVGPAATGSALLFFVSAYSLGSLLLRPQAPISSTTRLVATLTGISIYVLLMYAMARQPWNYPVMWGVLLALPVLLAAPQLAREARDCFRGLLVASPLSTRGAQAGFALFAFVLGLHWFPAIKPEIGADALAMHLAIPANIALHHAYTFEPGRLLWAVMPRGADYAFSIVYLLGGEAGARLVNYGLLILLGWLIAALARRKDANAGGLPFLLAALFVSTPLVQLVTGSLFVENLLALSLLAGIASISLFLDGGQRRWIYAAALLCGAALSIKVGAAPIVIGAALLAAWAVRGRMDKMGPRPVAACVLAVALLVGAGAPPYLEAWQKTGDPFFPFAAASFPSPLLPQGFSQVDERFQEKLSPASLPKLVFETSRFYEGQNGSFGFQYLLLLPLAALALIALRDRFAAGCGAVALVGAVAVLAAQPNTRYLYPAMALAVLPFAAFLRETGQRNRTLVRLMAVYAFGCLSLNLVFLPSSSWYHKDFSMPLPFRKGAAARYLAVASPRRLAIEYLNRTDPHSSLLLVEGGEFAGFQGKIFENHWHQLSTRTAISSARDPLSLVLLFTQWKIGYFLEPTPLSDYPDLPAAFGRVLATCTTKAFETRGALLLRFDATRPGCHPAVLTQGTYDDVDPSLACSGAWTRDSQFAQAHEHSLSYSDVRGAECSLQFEGTAVTYYYTKAFNRGLAGIEIDGTERATLDLYSPQIQWQSSTRFAALSPGRHTLRIRVTGRAQPASKGRFVDVDAIGIE